MSAAAEKAILAGGCFWGMQDLFRKQPGVLSTRVGYAGGDVPNATYRNHGTHAEAIEIIFDPEQTSYRQVLELFFQIHDPTTLEPSGQRRRNELPLGDLLPRRRAAARRRGHDCRRRLVGALAGEGGDGGGAGRAVLGGRARAPGLPRAVPERLHLPLRTARVGCTRRRRSSRRLASGRISQAEVAAWERSHGACI